MPEPRRSQDKWRHGDGKPSAGGNPVTPRGKPGTSKLFLSALFLASLIGIVIGLLFFLRPAPKPVFLSIAVTEYADRRFPVNAYAQQDSEALRKHFGADSVQAFQSQERELILRELNQLAERSKGEANGRPIVAHLSANAFVEAGDVYVVPGNATGGSSATSIRLEELLDPLKRVQGDRLLLLDLRPVIDARLGLLESDLAGVLQQKLAGLNLPFRVIVSCGAGSTPVVSRELRRSAFGWFLDRGLSGVADAGDKKNDRVEAEELVQFVRQNVAGFTRFLEWEQVAEIQGTGRDFVILPVRQGGPAAAAPPQAADEYPGWLFAGWQERDRWRAEGVPRRLPRTFRHLEVILLRAESQWLGGVDLAKAQSEFDNDLRELRAVKSRFPLPVPPMRSLAQAEKNGLPGRRDAEALIQPLLERIKANPAPKKEELADVKKLQDALREKAPDAAAVAHLLFNAAVGRAELTIEQLKQLDQTLLSLPAAPRFAETAVLRAIAQADPKRLKLWEPEPGTIPRLLLATQMAEQAVAVDGRCLPWLIDELKAAETLRREGIEGLLSGDADVRERARGLLDRCRERYAAIADAGKALESAFTQRDETRLFLVSWAGFEAPDVKLQQELDALWASIVGECRELQPLLKAPKQAGLLDVATLKNKANDLQFRRERVLALMKVPGNAKPVELPRWLKWPFWTAEQRRQLVEQTAATALPQVERALLAAPPNELVAGGQPRSTSRLARQALDLLMLADDGDLSKAEKLFKNLSKSPEAATELGQLISRHWMTLLPEHYRDRNDLNERERLGWAIHPFDLPAIPRVGDTFPRDAAAESFRKQQKDFAIWIGIHRDQGDAEMLRKLDTPAARNLAATLEELAREQLNWNP